MRSKPSGIAVQEIAALKQLQIVRFHNREWKTNLVLSPQPKRPGLALAGYPANVDAMRIQIFGKTEMGYLYSLDAEQRVRCLRQYLKRRFPVIIVSSMMETDKMLVRLAKEFKTPILVSGLGTSLLISRLSASLFRHFSKKVKVNGVLLDVIGQGVMITGSSGVGKSESALELINKGYTLIADDVVEFYLNFNDDPVGCSNPLIQNLMEVRGLGIINIQDIFGPLAVIDEKKLDLVINLEKWDPKKKYDRLGEDSLYFRILGKDIPTINIPVAPGRNVSTLIEVAVRYFLARKKGKKTYLEGHKDKMKTKGKST